MKTLEELKSASYLLICETGPDGGRGEIHFHHWTGSVIWSFGGGWEHVSVAPYKRHITPSWDDMCRIKDMFWREDEVVVQYHPAKSDYVNMVGNCLHLWRPIEKELPVPNSLMVGMKAGQTMKDVRGYLEGLEDGS